MNTNGPQIPNGPFGTAGSFFWRGHGAGWSGSTWGPHAEAAASAAASGTVHNSAFHQHHHFRPRFRGGPSRFWWFLIGAGTTYWFTRAHRNCDERKELYALRARFQADQHNEAGTTIARRSWNWQWPPRDESEIPNPHVMVNTPRTPATEVVTSNAPKSEATEATLQAIETAQKAINAKIDAFRAAVLKGSNDDTSAPPQQPTSPPPSKSRWL